MCWVGGGCICGVWIEENFFLDFFGGVGFESDFWDGLLGGGLNV